MTKPKPTATRKARERRVKAWGVWCHNAEFLAGTAESRAMAKELHFGMGCDHDVLIRCVVTYTPPAAPDTTARKKRRRAKDKA